MRFRYVMYRFDNCENYKQRWDCAKYSWAWAGNTKCSQVQASARSNSAKTTGLQKVCVVSKVSANVQICNFLFRFLNFLEKYRQVQASATSKICFPKHMPFTTLMFSFYKVAANLHVYAVLLCFCNFQPCRFQPGWAWPMADEEEEEEELNGKSNYPTTCRVGKKSNLSTVNFKTHPLYYPPLCFSILRSEIFSTCCHPCSWAMNVYSSLVLQSKLRSAPSVLEIQTSS